VLDQLQTLAFCAAVQAIDLGIFWFMRYWCHPGEQAARIAVEKAFLHVTSSVT